MQTQNDNDLHDDTTEQAGNVGRAVIAWLIAAVLAVTFAAIVSIEAQAAPLGSQALNMELERGSVLLLFSVAGVAVFAVAWMMWRDLARQAQRASRRHPRY